ncbi:MAG: sigma 54-interacting transcriptional regulator [Myxococcota bacterium]|nr:sigma 54-interacting transcriptional regulator [Myxococcota bacterium]
MNAPLRAPHFQVELLNGGFAGQQLEGLAPTGLTGEGMILEQLNLPPSIATLSHNERGYLLCIQEPAPVQAGAPPVDFTHCRAGSWSTVEEEVELWSDDLVAISYGELFFRMRFILPEVESAEVVAERSIEQLGAMAEQLQQSPERLARLYQHNTQLSRCQTLSEVFEAAARLCFELFPRATQFSGALREDGGRFPVVHACDRSGELLERPLSKTLIRQVIERRSGLLLMDAAAEFGGASVLQAGLASALIVPLWVGAEVKGVIQLDNRDAPGLFSTEDLELLTVAASSISLTVENARLIHQLRRAEERLTGENSYLRARTKGEHTQIIGESSAMLELLSQIERVRDLKIPVCITGETGTGKELVARALHEDSRRREKLFVAQNCGALPENLLESELFGHVKGAFTGADRDKKGLFELADEGTIFLDEIGEMSLPLQSKLLRVLQESEIRPIGATRAKKVNVRVISATHRDLEEMVRKGEFRQDLFYRIHVYPILLPPLRLRRSDIALLARSFLSRYREEFGRPVSAISQGALQRLQAYDWPGNVRELQNEIQRALIQRIEGDLILEEDLSPHISGLEVSDAFSEALELEGSLKEMMGRLEAMLLKRALERHDGNKTQTAKTLGITREGLHKKLNRFSISS